MKIIVAGAGAVGSHLAKMLSQESHDIFLQLTRNTVYLDIDLGFRINRRQRAEKQQQNKEKTSFTHS